MSQGPYFTTCTIPSVEVLDEEIEEEEEQDEEEEKEEFANDKSESILDDRVDKINEEEEEKCVNDISESILDDSLDEEIFEEEEAVEDFAYEITKRIFTVTEEEFAYDICERIYRIIELKEEFTNDISESILDDGLVNFFKKYVSKSMFCYSYITTCCFSL